LQSSHTVLLAWKFSRLANTLETRRTFGDWQSRTFGPDLPALDLDEQEQDHFGTVLGNLPRDRLASFEVVVRQSGHSSIDAIITGVEPITCRLQPKISCRSYHAVLTLPFADGNERVFKFSAKGHHRRWTEATAKALQSEAQTMGLICRETTIPVPEVFAFNPSIDDELGCPLL